MSVTVTPVGQERRVAVCDVCGDRIEVWPTRFGRALLAGFETKHAHDAKAMRS